MERFFVVKHELGVFFNAQKSGFLVGVKLPGNPLYIIMYDSELQKNLFSWNVVFGRLHMTEFMVSEGQFPHLTVFGQNRLPVEKWFVGTADKTVNCFSASPSGRPVAPTVNLPESSCSHLRIIQSNRLLPPHSRTVF